jgi:hypothetical protein
MMGSCGIRQIWRRTVELIAGENFVNVTKGYMKRDRYDGPILCTCFHEGYFLPVYPVHVEWLDIKNNASTAKSRHFKSWKLCTTSNFICLAKHC